jgi:cytochrome P450
VTDPDTTRRIKDDASMELRQLRYAVAVAEELHFGRAAAREHTTASALSQQVARLERELQVTLFERTPRRVVPTAAGAAFVAEARRVLAGAAGAGAADPSVQGTTRLAHADTTLAGTPVRAGATVLVLTAAANRDSAAHPDPAVFDPHRTGEPDHLTFSSGIHYCLGAPLARLEGEVAFRIFAARLPDLRLLPGARRRPGAIIRGYAALPARG